MRIRIGSSGIPLASKGGTSIDGLRKIAELGLNAMEISFTHGIYMSNKDAVDIGNVAKGLDVELSIHAPYYINLASDKKKVVEDSKKRIFTSLDRGNAMGATIVVAHAGYYGKDKEKANQMILEACQEISDAIDQNGWEIKFGPETMGKQSSWGTLDEIVELSKKLKNVVPYLDPAHIYAGNGGRIDYKEIFEKIRVLKLKRYNSHFSGIQYTPVGESKGNERNHVPIKEGDPGFEAYAKEFLKRKKDMTIISESPILEIDALLMKSIIEKLGSSI